ncbi:hypothetical protein GIB67_042727 [Kingdonia uniflora]|uniref:Uncharacterized protein n=1 Tax=Kingdonia uniflora TaxID=39325 RepID=A0A7J7NDJ7_9MAGN|nr:hypothetical protein GIB67_042727 [Kingdonia uniflora]
MEANLRKGEARFLNQILSDFLAMLITWCWKVTYSRSLICEQFNLSLRVGHLNLPSPLLYACAVMMFMIAIFPNLCRCHHYIATASIFNFVFI